MSEPTRPMFMSRNQLVNYAMRLEEENNNLKTTGAKLSKETMVVMLNGMAHEELIKAHDDWKDLVDGKPKWGKTCTK